MKHIIAFLLIIFLSVFPAKAQLTILTHLDEYPNAGHQPHDAVIKIDHYLYTLTARGGPRNWGEIIRYDLLTDSLQSVFYLRDTTGHYPYGSVVYDGTNLYGMTNRGGRLDIGTAFKFNLQDSTFHTMFEFTGQGPPNEGTYPDGNFIIVGDYLYGMTQVGGAHILGNIFRIKISDWTFENLYDLDSADGTNPWADLYYDGSYFYGVTSKGGATDSGTIFKFDPGTKTYTKLHDFDKPSGGWAFCTLISDGTYLYGTTMRGGNDGQGVIFRIEKDGSNYTVLYHFSYTTGGSPAAGLTLVDNALYGTMISGGANGYGGLFKYDLATNTFTVLCDFPSDISQSTSTLLFYNNYLYGTSSGGGPHDQGSIYRFQLYYPEISVSQGQNYIPDSGSVDFGTVPTNTHKDLTFTITNTSSKGVLNIWGNPNITLKDGSVFSVVQYPASTIDQGASSNFVVRFKAQDTQNYADTLIIRNDDPDENPYIIVLHGKGATATAIEDLDNEIAIYPNPCKNYLFVRTPQIPQSISLYDISGKRVMQVPNPHALTRINLTHLPQATYVLKIKTKDGTLSKRIIKQ